jgi:hypothetical protein
MNKDELLKDKKQELHTRLQITPISLLNAVVSRARLKNEVDILYDKFYDICQHNEEHFVPTETYEKYITELASCIVVCPLSEWEEEIKSHNMPPATKETIELRRKYLKDIKEDISSARHDYIHLEKLRFIARKEMEHMELSLKDAENKEEIT